ncbi:MBL fold metallo-hydrolase [Pseudomonas putida]|uniref:alkyl/aryl-sulfatase n=1 Tax=Pseudomonadaceae TaxID=135621 RepID=UPI00053D0B4C|nr:MULTISPECIES: alkyl sulfatase dimerization domain-containing protein [Pseudomonadaceae]MBA1265354.1 MBL fold metallo-hydrolase [Stutzerimonas stutzeri]MBI6945232.1 MBL fold metallo-hydrolase [Pseudomonas putida]MBI6961557.1 MBL fold metallo-hydrolase [Pseudomonas putida]
MNKQRYAIGLLAASLCLPLIASANGQPAEPTTVEANAAVLQQLDFSDRKAFEDARRGFIAAPADGPLRNPDGSTAWDMSAYAFVEGEAPDTVNPSLWRQAQLNGIHGLFKVTDGIYQIRGMDLANMTVIEGQTGLIIIDPLLSPTTARAALDLYLEHRPSKPVVAVIYTHSHVDHFAGVRGIVSDEDIQQQRVRIYAPEGFMEHAVSENVIAGNAMTRRAMYMYGTELDASATGHVDNGLGKALSHGALTLIPPTDIITANGTKVIDGVEVEFHLAQGSEAPAEMMMYFPAARVLNTAEVTSHQLHNIYTLRGAEVRDASLWSRYIDEVLEKYGPRTDILMAQHHWPVWNQDDARHFLAVQRDLYKFIHDQSVRLMNQGYRPDEIAEQLTLPASLAKEWIARDYYGTLRHNARAIYQKYLGWYDANPANLNPLPTQEAARKAMEYMGGIEQVISRARQDFDRGEYRWVASVMSQAVFAEPDNQTARQLNAAALEQLGYQAESGPWRNVYLSGAMELRNGTAQQSAGAIATDLLQALDTGMFFDLLGVRLNGPRAEGKQMLLNWSFTDTDEQFRLNLQNATLTWLPERSAPDADASITMTRATLNAILTQQNSFPAAIKSGDIRIEGNPQVFLELLSLMDHFTPDFALIEPITD